RRPGRTAPEATGVYRVASRPSQRPAQAIGGGPLPSICGTASALVHVRTWYRRHRRQGTIARADHRGLPTYGGNDTEPPLGSCPPDAVRTLKSRAAEQAWPGTAPLALAGDGRPRVRP